ncbi:hypothetical protein KFU94_01495 [Chloroflexi bacterium TSY]|nr:hypothetical protein [Chloroflexi bacterium TSY]
MDVYLELKIQPESTYWAEVEYLSKQGEWRTIESLKGQARNGFIRWFICAADFKSEFSYRWRIFLPGSLEVLATSTAFSLPKQHNETIRSSIMLVPHLV